MTSTQEPVGIHNDAARKSWSEYAGIQDCLHVTHYYFINFIKGLIPVWAKYTSFHKYVIMITSLCQAAPVKSYLQ